MSELNEVASTDLLCGTHLCDTCAKEFPTCDAKKIVWGIDRDPSARGADADRVLECDAYTPNASLTLAGKEHRKHEND